MSSGKHATLSLRVRLFAAVACVLALGFFRPPTLAATVVLDRAEVIDSEAAVLPDNLPAMTVALPDLRKPNGSVQYRITFAGPHAAQHAEPWAVYLPYLHGGGRIWLNGTLVAHVPSSTAQRRVRWERPMLATLPPSLLRASGNVLEFRVEPASDGGHVRFPRVQVGPVGELREAHDRRQFWVRTMPQVTVVVCMLVACFVTYIWVRRPGEVFYALFGLAAALWGVRTLTFIIESAPVQAWVWWRIVYLASTGGFIVVMALFSLRMAGIRHRAIEATLKIYTIAGPAWLVWRQGAGEDEVNRLWTAGLIPIGLSIIGISMWHLMRVRTWTAAAMPIALAIAAGTGIHDYLLAWDRGAMQRMLGDWALHRVFLLHHGANVLLLTMGVLLTARFVQALNGLEDLNRTLESRVADREATLAENYASLARMQQHKAAAEERALIMREIHDGLGSRLFTTLSRVQRGDMDQEHMARSLHACIADMRLALEALAPGNEDFRSALGDLMFRWQTHLEEAHVRTDWHIDVPDSELQLPPQAALQVLRIAQEALTNVLRHARATQVKVRLSLEAEVLVLEVADNGCGSTSAATRTSGQGQRNMRARAARLGGTLGVLATEQGTRVMLHVPLFGLKGAAMSEAP